jgi:serine/threonine-protein kinase
MEIGTVLAGKYRVDRVIGRGGMGLVVQAMHLQLEQPVAVKFLLPEVLGNAQVVQRFLREAQAAVRLKSEHVARVIDVGQFDNGAPYMVLEYLDGLDLAHFPRQHLTVGLMVDFMLQASEALAEAHALGIVHRDIKPANFFITRSADGAYLVKILDFGISKAPTQQGDRNLTATMMVMGTPAYMSPEQMRASKNVDNRSDIWSLGIVLYELLQGTPPYESDTFSSMIIKVVTEPLPPMTVRLPAGLAEIVYRCLEKDPTRRFQNVAELATAIAPYAQSSMQAAITVERTSRVLGTYPPRTNPPSTITASSGAVTQPTGGKRKWPIFAAAGAMLVIGVVIVAAAASGGGSGDASSAAPGASPPPAREISPPPTPPPAQVTLPPPTPSAAQVTPPPPAAPPAPPTPPPPAPTAAQGTPPPPAPPRAQATPPPPDVKKPDASKVTVHRTPPKPPPTPTTPATKPPTPPTKPGPGSGGDDILGTRN